MKESKSQSILFDFTVEELARLRHSFVQLVPRIDGIARTFYEHLFEDFPAVSRHFGDGLEAQQLKFVDTIALLLDILDQPSRASAMLIELGARHVGYGATGEIYHWVKTAFPAILLCSLEKEELIADPDLYMQLWPRFISLVVDSMREGAHATEGMVDSASESIIKE